MNFYDWKRLRQDAAFQALFRKVRTAVKKNQERSVLNHHTTGSCRANEVPIPSLKACGLDDPIACPDGDGNVLHVCMPNTFYAGDGRALEYWSAPFPSSASGERVFQNIACLEILTVLLATQPNIVRMPVRCVSVDPNWLRGEGRKTWADRLKRWTDPFGDVLSWEPLLTDESIHRVSLKNKGRALQYYVPGTSDEEIVGVMRSWGHGQRTYVAHRMPLHRRIYLQSVLPPGGLRAFLTRNFATFEYRREQDNSLVFKFRSSASGEQIEQQPLMVLDDDAVEPTASSQAATSSQAEMAGVEILENKAQPAASASRVSPGERPGEPPYSSPIPSDWQSWSRANWEGYGRTWSKIPKKKKGSRGVCTDPEGGHLWYEAATDTWAKEPEGDRKEDDFFSVASEGAFGEPAWTHSTSSVSQSWERGGWTWDGYTWDEDVGYWVLDLDKIPKR